MSVVLVHDNAGFRGFDGGVGFVTRVLPSYGRLCLVTLKIPKRRVPSASLVLIPEIV